MYSARKRLISCVNNFLPFHSVCNRKTSLFLNIRRSKSESSEHVDVSEKRTNFETPVKNIRNFSIIAHVDHGKSTLADRFLEITGAITADNGQSQVLDRLQVERERGITVKAQSASLKYVMNDTEYMLNLIDTPGHVDFSNEVSRSLAACQGVILLVDANQGVQAQTVANFFLAFSQDIAVIPVLNKIDLKNAEPERVIEQLNNLFDINEEDVLKVKTNFRK